MDTWRVPTPHEFFTFCFILVESIRESGIFAPTTGVGRVLSLIGVACAIVGVSAARAHISPRVRGILEERDRALQSQMSRP
jgi:hypothetical protein